MSQGNVDLGVFKKTKVAGGGEGWGVIEVIERVSDRGNGGTEPALRRHLGLLLRGGALFL